MPGEVAKVYCGRLAEPSRAGPGRAEPSASRAEPSRAEREREPSRAEPGAGRAEPSPRYLPPLPAFSLHVFSTFFDTSHMECLLFGPLSLLPIFSDFLPPSLPPQPAFSLHVFLTFFNPSPTECLLFGSYGDLSDLWRSMAGRAGRAEPTWAGCGCGSLWLWLAVAVAGSPRLTEVFA